MPAVTSFSRCALSVAALSLMILAGGSASAQQVPGRWYVYNDSDSEENHGEWTNVMPAEGAQMIKLNLVDRTNPASGTTSVRVEIKFASPWWSGLAVASVADYWGDKPGAAAYNLQGATKLVFKARGERGDESIQVRVGITGDKRYGDSLRLPASTPWITLTKEWRTYELDVAGLDLKRIITPFVFVANRDHNPDGGLVFHLDEVHFLMGAGK